MINVMYNNNCKKCINVVCVSAKDCNTIKALTFCWLCNEVVFGIRESVIHM